MNQAEIRELVKISEGCFKGDRPVPNFRRCSPKHVAAAIGEQIPEKWIPSLSPLLWGRSAVAGPTGRQGI